MGGTQQIGDIGGRLDLLMREGTTFGPVFATMRGPAQQSINLTGAVVRGSVKRRVSDTAPLVTFQAQVVNALGGRIEFGLSSAQTRLLAVDRRHNPLTLFWEMVYEDARGYVRPLLYGEVTLHLSVAADGG